MGEKVTPKKELDDELEDMSDEEKPRIAPEKFGKFDKLAFLYPWYTILTHSSFIVFDMLSLVLQ